MTESDEGKVSGRTAAVLEPSFIQRLDLLSLDELHRRRDEALAEPIAGRELEEALDALVEEERAVSGCRAAVIKVHDALQGELMRRFREDPSLVTRNL